MYIKSQVNVGKDMWSPPTGKVMEFGLEPIRISRLYRSENKL
jgi:hypothetical protein